MWQRLPPNIKKIIQKHILPGSRFYVPKLKSRKNIPRRDELINIAFRAGASFREIGNEFKLSHTRVQQIIKKDHDKAARPGYYPKEVL